jgi:phosphatidylserine decarboxylase
MAGLPDWFERSVAHTFSFAPLSRAAGRLSDLRLPRPVMGALVRGYTRGFGIDHGELDRGLDEYRCLNDFFTRGLPAHRDAGDPARAVLSSPADGVLQESGPLDGKNEFVVKRQRIDVPSLTGDSAAGARFKGGSYSLIYLSPRHYHRVHAPAGGRLLGYRFLPGRLFPVNRLGMDHVPGMFMRNERVVLQFATPRGAVWMVMVGASFVGRMTLNCDGFQTNDRWFKKPLDCWLEPSPEVAMGDEVGAFNVGSSVVLLSEQPASAYTRQPGEVRVGDELWTL